LPSLPPLSTLPTAPTGDRTYTLDLLFEPSQPLQTLALPLLSSTTFQSYSDLIAAIGVLMTELAESASSSDTVWLEKILGAHPRLGEKRVESGLSREEQAHLKAGGGEGGEGEAETEQKELERLNALYEAAFPGLRYVTFVNGRSRQDIFRDMNRRIERADIRAERREAIKAMCEIAADRVRKL
ncbi:hypothetical protein K490DRAFT_6117, partial [Saccharata proteae CBS 121410]